MELDIDFAVGKERYRWIKTIEKDATSMTEGIMFIFDLLGRAKCNRLEELIGKPVEVMVEKKDSVREKEGFLHFVPDIPLVLDWRILTEVL